MVNDACDSMSDGLKYMATAFTMEAPVPPVTGIPYAVVIKDNVHDDTLIGLEFWFKKDEVKRHVGTYYPDEMVFATNGSTEGSTFSNDSDEELFKWINTLALIPGCDYVLDFMLNYGIFWSDYGERWISTDEDNLVFTYKTAEGWSTLVLPVGDAELIRKVYFTLDWRYKSFKKDELTDKPLGLAPILQEEIIKTIKDLLSVEKNYGWAEGEFVDLLKFDVEGIHAITTGHLLSCQFCGYRLKGSTSTTTLQFNAYVPGKEPVLDDDVEGKPHTCIPTLEYMFRTNGIRYKVQLMKGSQEDGLYHVTRYLIEDNIGSIVFDVGYLVEPKA